jgi:FkbM family methyltransferase
MSLNIDSNIYNQQIKTNIDYIFKNSILYDKLWEHDICEKICTFIEDGTDFIDIGANIGLITLGVKICLKNKKIQTNHCIECDIDNFVSLKFNTAIHSDIFLYNFALADKSQLCNMSTNDYNNGCNIINTSYTNEKITTYDYTHINNVFKKNNNIFISAISLDSISYIFTNKVSVIKIDVEGFEDLVLEGAKLFLEKHKPTIFIEIFDEKYNKTLELLTSLNYILLENIGNLNYIFVYL